MSYVAWKNTTTDEFIEYEQEMQTYYVYGASGNGLYGRPLQRIDRNGNELNYHYSNNSDGKPLLRKITGDLGGITPYFEYANESYPAVITKVHIENHVDPSDSRDVTFTYNNTSSAPASFLNKVTFPSSATQKYTLSELGPHQKIDTEEDASGKKTNFSYTGGLIYKVTEPENGITYYNYNSLQTVATKKDRPSTTFDYVKLPASQGDLAQTKSESQWGQFKWG